MKTIIANYRVIYRVLILCFLFLCFLSCSGLKGPLFKPLNEIPENQSVVYIYLPEGRGNAEFLIKYNEQEICLLKNGGYFPFHVKPGKVGISSAVQFKMFATGILDVAIAGQSELVFEAEAEKAYFLKCEPDDMVQKLNIVLVPEKFGANNIKKCRLLDSGL